MDRAAADCRPAPPGPARDRLIVGAETGSRPRAVPALGRQVAPDLAMTRRAWVGVIVAVLLCLSWWAAVTLVFIAAHVTP
jgi:hypothetical protein